MLSTLSDVLRTLYLDSVLCTARGPFNLCEALPRLLTTAVCTSFLYKREIYRRTRLQSTVCQGL